MSKIFVADMAAVTGLGESLGQMWPRLCAGESATRPVERFETGRLDFHSAACVAGLEHGPTDHLVCNLMSRCLGQLRPVPPGTAVIWAGVKSASQYIEQQVAGETPTKVRWPWQLRRWACELLGLDPESTPGLEINAACASSAVGLALGAQMIRRGECASVLVCAADAVSRFTFTGFAALKALSPNQCRPFDRDRDGLCLGDGAAAMLLANEDLLKTHGYSSKARLSGWGVANDATHITAPARDGRGLERSIRAALETAQVRPEAIQAFCAHGTGTVYNDAMELTALESIFGERRFPVFSIKGAVGHTLGAAGALEAAVCIQALHEGRVPATAGLLQPEARAVGRAEAKAQSFGGHNILTTNSGFGGINAALVFVRE
jgi:3-oxoacyl-[acyl-carrier-protein] synthase II